MATLSFSSAAVGTPVQENSGMDVTGMFTLMGVDSADVDIAVMLAANPEGTGNSRY